VTLIVRGTTVVLAEGVEVGSGRGTSVAGNQLRSSHGEASLRVVSELASLISKKKERRKGKDVLDVESSLGVGIEVLDLQPSVVIPRR